MKKTALFYSLLCLLAVGVASAALAEPRAIKISSSLNEGSFAHVFLTEFEQRVEAELGETIDIQVFMGGVLGSEQDVLTGLKIGTHDATLSASRVASINAKAAVFDLPYLFQDHAKVQAFIDSDAFQILNAGFTGTGASLVAMWDNGFRVITNNVRPITTPADLEGLKIRTPNSRFRVAMFNTLGANATPLSFKEVYSALDQGVVDGQENPASVVYSAKLHEVQKYVSVSNHVYLPTFLLFSDSLLASLDDPVREQIVSIAQEMGPWTRQWGEANDQSTFEKLTAAGAAVNEVDFAAFQKASEPLYNDALFTDTIGADMIEATLKAVR